MNIDCISDLHCSFPELPGGDVLIIAGDISYNGSMREIAVFNAWVANQKYDAKILVAGNHDWLFQDNPTLAKSLIPGITHYLEDSGCTIDGVTFWGSPVQPEFCDWAFNRKRGAEIKRHWDQIPDGVDVLVTHGPPYGILDQTKDGLHVGCEELLKAVQRVKPLVNVFGHIHEGYGQETRDGTLFINCAIVDERYRLVNAPIRFSPVARSRSGLLNVAVA